MAGFTIGNTIGSKPLVKPKKTKKKGKGSKTATAALNTYKSVKQKIFGTKESRTAKRSTRKANKNSGEFVEDIYQLPRLENRVQEIEQPVRSTGAYLDTLSIDEKMKTPGNIARGLINRETGIAYNTPFGEEGSMREFIMETQTKKSNTWLYLIIALVVAFAVYKMAAKK